MRKRSTSKTALMTTIAAAAVAGFTTIATAQTMQNPPAAGSTKPETGQSGKTIEQKGGLGGAMKYQNGAQSGEKSSAPSGQSAQEGAKPGERMDQNSAQTEKSPGEKSPGEKSAEQKGAQTEPGKSGAGAMQQNAQGGVKGGATSRGASVQLSQDQKSRIGGMIGKRPSARVTSNVDFDIAVGATVPRTVHVVALPEDVVHIVPQYEGYDYIVVHDQILIVDPDDMEIVAVIET